ncbi:hypothetical protein PFISCL1PPCAC_9296, partial [Pristionchus fissidentatus]
MPGCYSIQEVIITFGSENEKFPLLSFPSEIIAMIFAHLDRSSRLKLRAVNRKLRRIGRSTKFPVHFLLPIKIKPPMRSEKIAVDIPKREPIIKKVCKYYLKLCFYGQMCS